MEANIGQCLGGMGREIVVGRVQKQGLVFGVIIGAQNNVERGFAFMTKGIFLVTIITKPFETFLLYLTLSKTLKRFSVEGGLRGWDLSGVGVWREFRWRRERWKGWFGVNEGGGWK